jgi:DNA-binding response OmpR family regulator
MSNNSILIIAHDDNTRRSLADVFSYEEYTVFTASSGQKGLELLMKEQPALALIDQVMPDMDGVETLRRFKEIRPETQIIMQPAMALLIWLLL